MRTISLVVFQMRTASTGTPQEAPISLHSICTAFVNSSLEIPLTLASDDLLGIIDPFQLLLSLTAALKVSHRAEALLEFGARIAAAEQSDTRVHRKRFRFL